MLIFFLSSSVSEQEPRTLFYLLFNTHLCFLFSLQVSGLLMRIFVDWLLINNFTSSLHWFSSWFWLRSSNLKSNDIGSVDVVIWRGGRVTAGFEINEEEDEVKDYQDESLSLVCGLINICHGVTLDSGLDSQLLK